MGMLSLDDARAFLMGDHIQPLSILDEPDTDASEIDGPSSESLQADELDMPDVLRDSEGRAFTSLHEAERAAFEATLDAAFGPAEGSPFRQEYELQSQQSLQDEDDADNHVNSYNDGMVGLGVDIVEIDRMKNILKRSPAFASKVFSLQEQLYCDSRSNPAAHYAVRFAAKEAVVKALGTGFSKGIGVRDIEIERTKNGRPLVVLSGVARKIADEQGVLEISLSMSYTKTDAVACAMALTRAVVCETEKRKDPMKELAQQFKETRKILDDL